MCPVQSVGSKYPAISSYWTISYGGRRNHIPLPMLPSHLTCCNVQYTVIQCNPRSTHLVRYTELDTHRSNSGSKYTPKSEKE